MAASLAPAVTCRMRMGGNLRSRATRMSARSSGFSTGVSLPPVPRAIRCRPRGLTAVRSAQAEDVKPEKPDSKLGGLDNKLMSDNVSRKMKERINNVLGVDEASITVDDDENKALFLSLIIGLSTGFLVVCFELLQETIREVAYEDWLPFVGTSEGEMLDLFGDLSTIHAVGAGWQIAVVPLFGGLIIAGVRKAIGNDFGPALKVLNKDVGKAREIEPAKVAVKTASAAVTLGTANSMGPEGPVVELGGNIGLIVGRQIGYRGEDLRSFLAAGAAAGLAAGFNAPISAIFFALEVVLQNTTEKQALTLTLLSAVIAGLVKDITLGLEPKFSVPPSTLHGVAELPFFLLVGGLCGVAAYLFEKANAKSTKVFAESPIPVNLRPIVGALICVGVAMFLPQVLFLGYRGVDTLLEEDLTITLDGVFALILLTPAKILVTSAALGSGLVGGVFAPSLFIGALVGTSVGDVLQLAGLGAFEGGLDIVANPPTYTLIGMAAMLAALVKAPLTSILLVFEITRDYNTVLPVMAGVGMATFVDNQIAKTFSKKMVGSSVSIGGACSLETLEATMAEQAMYTDVVKVPATTMLVDAAKVVAKAQAEQASLSCRGVVLTGENGLPVAGATVTQIMEAVDAVVVELRAAFTAFDKDGSGEISVDEVIMLLKELGVNAEPSEVTALVASLDKDGTGELTFSEFCEGAGKLGVDVGTRSVGEAFINVRNTKPYIGRKSNLLKATQKLSILDASCVVVVENSEVDPDDVEAVGIILREGVMEACKLARLEMSIDQMTI